MNASRGTRTYQLEDLETREVSLVDVAANKRKFAFRKDNGEAMNAKEAQEFLSAILETPLENEAALQANLEKAGYDKRTGTAVRSAIKILQANADALSDQHKQALNALSSAAREEEEEDDKGGKGSKENKNKAAGGGSTPTPEPKVEMSPEVKAQFDFIKAAREKDQAELLELRKSLQARDDADKVRAAVAKAESEYPALSGHDKIGNLLHKAAGLGEEALKDLEDTLRAANERAKLGGTDRIVGKSHGTSRDWAGSNGTSAEAQLQAKTLEIAKNGGLDMRQAFVKACEQNPKLYDAYEAERTQNAKNGVLPTIPSAQ